MDHATIGRWALRYAPELYKPIRREIRKPNRSWRVDETCICVAGVWTHLYRAVDSSGETIDFMLSPERDVIAAKHFLQNALLQTGQVRPHVINVDGHCCYPPAIAELRASGELGRHCLCRPVPYLNNVLAIRTMAGYEAMNMIRKGQVRWLAKGDIVGQMLFVEQDSGSLRSIVLHPSELDRPSISVCDRFLCFPFVLLKAASEFVGHPDAIHMS